MMPAPPDTFLVGFPFNITYGWVHVLSMTCHRKRHHTSTCSHSLQFKRPYRDTRLGCLTLSFNLLV